MSVFLPIPQRNFLCQRALPAARSGAVVAVDLHVFVGQVAAPGPGFRLAALQVHFHGDLILQQDLLGLFLAEVHSGPIPAHQNLPLAGGQHHIDPGHINIGIAVALPNGLVVPVVRNADKLSLEQINAESKRLVGLAKGGGLGGDDMRGGTFSITNLGMVGIDAFTPIINMPESAILGIGRTVEEPSVVDGQICIRSKAIFSITHDHRVIDGYPAALFLQSLTRFIENPFLLMLD